MAKHTGPTTLELRKLASKQKVKLWKRIANDLEKPTRKRREVNLYKINKYTRNNEIALVPGKVLSLGNLDKKLTIAASVSSTDSTSPKIPTSPSRIKTSQPDIAEIVLRVLPFRPIKRD